MVFLLEVAGDGKWRRREFGAPILHGKWFAVRVLQSRSKRQAMTRVSNHTCDCEDGFRLTLPKKRPIELRGADKWA